MIYGNVWPRLIVMNARVRNTHGLRNLTLSQRVWGQPGGTSQIAGREEGGQEVRDRAQQPLVYLALVSSTTPAGIWKEEPGLL